MSFRLEFRNPLRFKISRDPRYDSFLLEQICNLLQNVCWSRFATGFKTFAGAGWQPASKRLTMHSRE